MKPSIIKGQITKLNKRLAALKPGEMIVIENLHNDVYHGSEGVSTSKIKVYLECPAKYYAEFVSGEVEREDKKVFDLGSAAHCLCLEPQNFNRDFVLQPSYIDVRRGNKWNAFAEVHAEQTILTSDQWEYCHAMRDAVSRHPFGSRLLTGGKAEVSYFKRDEETGLIVKCRTDYLLDDLIVDLKTCRSSEPVKFGRDAIRLGYHVQDAIYRDVTGIEHFSFVAVESEKPFVVTAPITCSENARELGFTEYHRALRGIRESLDFNLWPGYTTDPVEIDVHPSRLETNEEAA